jgi:hypothetical protein
MKVRSLILSTSVARGIAVLCAAVLLGATSQVARVAGGSVTVDEVLTMVNVALGNAGVTACEAEDSNHDMHITVDEILTAVNNALNGCEESAAQ